MSSLNIISENKSSVVGLKPPPNPTANNRSFMIKKEDDSIGSPKIKPRKNESLKNNQFQFKTDYASASSEEEFLEPSQPTSSTPPKPSSSFFKPLPSSTTKPTTISGSEGAKVGGSNLFSSSRPVTTTTSAAATPSSSQNKKPSSFGMNMDMFINPEKKAKLASMSPSMQRKSEEFSDEEEEDDEEEDDDDDEDDLSSEASQSMSDSSGQRSHLNRRSAVRPKRPNYTLSKDENQNKLKIKSLLLEIDELRERGFAIYTKYDQNSDINEMRNEIKLGNRFLGLKASDKIAENIFYLFIRGVEFIPNVFNPLKINLDGLYNDIVEQKDILDVHISDIVKKYTDGGNEMSPEMSLCMALITTIAMKAFENMGKDPQNPMMKAASMMFFGNSNKKPQTQQRIESGERQRGGIFGSRQQQGAPEGRQQQPRQQYSQVAAPMPLSSTTADTAATTSSDISGLFSSFKPKQGGGGAAVSRRFDSFRNPENSREPLVTPSASSKMNDDSERFSVASASSSEFSSSPKLTTSTSANTSKKPRTRSKKKSIDIF